MTLVVITILLATGMLWRTTRLPADSPRARMYRTESDLAALVNAVEHYATVYQTYPPSGADGLELAVKLRSETVNFFPEGPPRDAWGRQFIYNSTKEGSDYALYSLGANGLSDPQNSASDDITTDPDKPWRAVYRQLQTSDAGTDAH